eukprot:2879775-Pyramimonas_sp.AAC.1
MAESIVCCAAFSGICVADDTLEMCKVSLKNFYHALVGYNLVREGPQLMTLRIADVDDCYVRVFYCRMYGQGEKAFFLNAAPLDGADEDDVCATLGRDASGRCVARTWHMVIKALLLDSARKSGRALATFDQLEVTIWKTAPMLLHVPSYAVTMEFPLHRESLSLVRSRAEKSADAPLPFGLTMKKAKVSENDGLTMKKANVSENDGEDRDPEGIDEPRDHECDSEDAGVADGDSSSQCDEE